MLKNNIKLAWRSLTRNKLYTFLNFCGLAFGISSFVLVALYAIDEMTFDKFHRKADRIYRVIQHRLSPDQGEQTFGAVSFNAGLAARTEVAGVENSTRFLMWGRAVVRNAKNQRAFYQPFITVEQSFFQIFDFELVAGDQATALAEPYSIVLTETLAQKLFLGENAIGQTLHSDRGFDLKVTGILRDLPINSHLQFESLISHATMEAQTWWGEAQTSDWGSQNWGTYLLLAPGVDPSIVGKQLTAFAEIRAKEERPFEGHLNLQPLNDIHFRSQDVQREINEQKSSYLYLSIFSLIGLFILVIACINYINLSTARASNYQREVGVRRAIGAETPQLFTRFMTESFLLTCFALAGGWFLAQLLLPWFNAFSSKELTLNPMDSGWILPLMFTVVVVVSFVAGSYPALYLSRFRPAQVLRGHAQSKAGSGQGFLRQGLVVVQFTISLLMIIGTIVTWQQMKLVRAHDLGFDKEQMIVVDINSGRVRNGFEAIKNGYAQLPNVHSVTVSSRVPGEWKTLLQAGIRKPGDLNGPTLTPWFIGADEDFLETFDIALASGRNFDPQRPMDSSAVMINGQAADILGITEATGQEVVMVSGIANGSESPLEEPVRLRVIGIVENFNFQSLHQPVEPLIIGHRKNPIQAIDYFTVKISGQNVEHTIAQLTDILHQTDPEQVFEYHFLDDQIEQFYEADQQRSSLLTLAALCAIFIACLGLFGLATFTVEQRAKEIGIRKVLGASVSNIVSLLSKDFLKLVVIALLIASPIAFLFMQEWLLSFAYRVEIKWWHFAIAGISALGIAFLTVSYQSLKAAVDNPIKSLRDD